MVLKQSNDTQERLSPQGTMAETSFSVCFEEDDIDQKGTQTQLTYCAYLHPTISSSTMTALPWA